MIILIAVIFVLIGVVFLCANFLYNLAVNPAVDKSRIFRDHNDGAVHPENIFDTVQGEEVWLDSVDGLRLHGLLARQKEATDRWVIGIHGYTGCADEMGYRAGEFYRRGYHMLFPDNRGHGKSEGTYVGLGWHDRLDILTWIQWLCQRFPGCQIILYGLSMGGAAVMMTAGEKLPDNVRLIIEDCGYSSAKDEMAHEAKFLFHLPYFPLVSAASLICRIRAGYTFGEASAVKQLAKAEKPMLFLHGGKDTFVPTAMLDVVYHAAACPKEKLVIEGAGHGESYLVNPELYWDTVFGFIEKHGGF